MSNKKSNKTKTNRLEEKRRLERNKMLLQMQNEIKQLEFEIKHAKAENFKINMLKGLKISLRFGQLIAPFAVTAGITFGAFAAMGGTPFILDDQKKYLETKKEMDSLGNIRYEQQYEEFNSTAATISYVSKWEKASDGFYSRDVKTYNINEITEDIITKVINDVDILSLDEMFGKPKSSVETKNNLTDEELETKPHLQAVMYSKSDDDFIVVKESILANVSITVLWILITIIVEVLPLYYRDEISSFDYYHSIKRIKEKYPQVNVEELKKKMQIKMNNYNRLTR